MTTTEAIAFIGGPLMFLLFAAFVMLSRWPHMTALRWLAFVSACACVVVAVAAIGRV